MAKGKRISIPATTMTTRRERRRREKFLKKAKHIAYCTKKSAIEEAPAENTQETTADFDSSTEFQKKEKAAKKEKKTKAKLQKQKRQRQEQQQSLIEIEEREIRAYAKKLGLNKRKKKTRMPKSFDDAGLNYILEICQGGKNFENGDETPKNSSDEEDEFAGETEERDSPLEAGSRKRKTMSLDETSQAKPTLKSKSKKRVRFSDAAENERNFEDEMEFEENEEDGRSTELATSDQNQDANHLSSGDEDELKEDIYGRLRDKKGNVVKRNSDSSARPKLTSNSAGTASDLSEVDPKLMRTLKGSMNRLSEANARQLATQIGQLLLTYSKNDVKVVLTQSIFAVCLAPEIVPYRLIMEYCFLLAIIHSSVAVELSAYFIERLANEFRHIYETEKSADIVMDDKRLNNICQIFSFCYHLKVISSGLMMQLMQEILKNFTDRDIELILLILQSSGFLLRKDNPAELKSLMADVHRKTNDPVNAHLKNESRTKFMLDTLNAIKNNNDTKITNYDPTSTEHFRKILRASVKTFEPPLPMSLHDLYEAGEKGRWWIVGSAVTSNLIELKKSENAQRSKSASTTKTEFNDDLLELAKKHRMNTDLRRTIFCVIMSAEDYLDAFEKLTKLDLKGQQEREIVHVCLTCCVKERRFNPYYGLLIRQLCRYHKRFQLTTQYAIWDKFKLLGDFKPWQRRNLASLLSQLVACKAASLSILKVFEFGELETTSIKLLKSFFKDLLLNSTTAQVEEIFKRVVSREELKMFFDGILVFLQHYFARPESKISDEKRQLLNDRISVIEKLRFS